MGKVVTSMGMQDFVETGKVEVIKDRPQKEAKAAPPLEVVKEAQPVDLSEPKTEKVDEPEDTGLEADDADLAEKAQKRINKKHREMRQAEALAKKLREELDDSENFSKSQFERARMAEDKLTTLERELSELRAKATVLPEIPKNLKAGCKGILQREG